MLGSRKFEIFKPFLKVGDEVVIDAACSIQDASGFGVYDFELYINGGLGEHLPESYWNRWTKRLT